MESGPARDRVRAKTGTTDQSSALSGYVGARFAFAVLQNGEPGAVDAGPAEPGPLRADPGAARGLVPPSQPRSSAANACSSRIGTPAS